MKLYHLSEDENLTVLTPRIPKYAVGLFEDISTPRVCFAKTISGCLSALQDIPCTYYVYVPDEEVNIVVPTTKQVRDSQVNGEVWSLNSVKVKCKGIIKSYDYTKTKECIVNGDDYVTRFYYPWHWVKKYF